VDILSGADGREDLAAYRARGGYRGLTRALAMDPADVVAEIEAAALRGRGGAAFPTAAKWRAVREAPGDRRHLVVNGAEGEPGSFKDRELMRRSPHRVLEGIAVAAHALSARSVTFYVNDDFADALDSLRRALSETSSDADPPPLPEIRLVPETHVYLAGEETALINVLMGKPAIPWHKPPYPAHKGLYGEPTAVNNVETLALAALILERGADWYRQRRPVLFSLSGDVARPGVYERALGTPIAALLEAGGGGREGRPVAAILPGGYSTPLLTADRFDLPLDYDALRQAGTGLGASVIAISADRPLSEVADEVLAFFARESCGRCPTCIRGCAAMSERMGRLRSGAARPEEAADLAGQAARLRHKGICSFLDTAAHFAETAVEVMASPQR
jgi:NADH-quinone oxidoreductase subunit F